MKINGKPYQTIWLNDDGWSVSVIDQTRLPHQFVITRLTTLEEAAQAIRTMMVRGAPLIGVTAAYGLCLAVRQSAGMTAIDEACRLLAGTRPTAVNLRWALESMRSALSAAAKPDRVAIAYRQAAKIRDDDITTCEAIGRHGVGLIRELAARKRDSADPVVNILTHCNAGWLATVDRGTATAPIYQAFDEGIDVHVWVDETRPRNQGALTAFELGEHGVKHTVIVDNTGGHLMQNGLVDLCIVGTDRTAANGDVANKIGTYLKALAAHDNAVPFYVALPSTTIDWTISDGLRDIPIEQRSASEVAKISGAVDAHTLATVRLIPPSSPSANYAFDVTPARLVSGLITERGIAEASTEGLRTLFPRP